MDTNSTRMLIFKTLVISKKIMTLSDISRAIKMPQQKIAYHLPFLEDSGLIVKEENFYYCQPIFINEDLIGECLQSITDVTRKMLDTPLYLEEGIDEKNAETIIKNCMKALFLMSIEEID